MKHDREARARIVATAADLFARQGYNATGLNQILEESGAPKGSLYHYFPAGKEELAEVALATARHDLMEALATVLEGSPDFGAALNAVMGYFAGRMQGSAYQLGCPAATIALEEAATSERLQTASRDLYRDWSGRFAHALVRAGWPEERAGSLATLILAAVQGALLLARVEHDTAALWTITRELALVLEAGPPPAGQVAGAGPTSSGDADAKTRGA